MARGLLSKYGWRAEKARRILSEDAEYKHGINDCHVDELFEWHDVVGQGGPHWGDNLWSWVVRISVKILSKSVLDSSAYPHPLQVDANPKSALQNYSTNNRFTLAPLGSGLIGMEKLRPLEKRAATPRFHVFIKRSRFHDSRWQKNA